MVPVGVLMRTTKHALSPTKGTDVRLGVVTAANLSYASIIEFVLGKCKFS